LAEIRLISYIAWLGTICVPRVPRNASRNPFICLQWWRNYRNVIRWRCEWTINNEQWTIAGVDAKWRVACIGLDVR